MSSVSLNFINKKHEVVCGMCNKRLFKYLKSKLQIGNVVYANDFSPISKDIPQPVNGTSIQCSKCGARYYGYKWEKL